MKWKKSNKIPYQRVYRKFFTWRPVSINGEVVWLENITVRGYWWKGEITGNWYWVNEEFISNTNNESK